MTASADTGRVANRIGATAMALAASATRERRLDRGATGARRQIEDGAHGASGLRAGPQARMPGADARRRELVVGDRVVVAVWLGLVVVRWALPGSKRCGRLGDGDHREPAGEPDPGQHGRGDPAERSDPRDERRRDRERVGEGRDAGEHVEREVQAARWHGRGPAQPHEPDSGWTRST